MQKFLYIGRDAGGYRVTLELNLDAGRLSICGSSRNSAGQMQDTIRTELDAGTFKPEIPADDLREILDIWDRWHLNDMRPNCAHQVGPDWDTRRLLTIGKQSKAAGWVRPNEHPDGLLCKPCPVCGYQYGTEWKREDLPAEVSTRIVVLFNSTPAHDEGPEIVAFIKQHGLAMECARTLPDPSFPAGSTTFDCRIHNAAGELRTSYSMGPAHLETWIKEHCRPNPGGIVSASYYENASKERAKAWAKLGKTLAYRECMDAAREKYGHKFKPELRDVLSCIAQDCASVEGARDVDDWAQSLGYDPDGRKAEKIYRTIREQARAMEKMLGREAFEQFTSELDTEGR